MGRRSSISREAPSRTMACRRRLPASARASLPLPAAPDAQRSASSVLRLFPIWEHCIMSTCALSPSKRFAAFRNSIPMPSKPSRRGIVTPSGPPGTRRRISKMCTAMRALWAITAWFSIFGAISIVWWWQSTIRLASYTFALSGRTKTTTRLTWPPFKRTHYGYPSHSHRGGI
jgi:hypothetical protein